ncbi:MAG TPA: hypothetical protein PLS33_03030, partial [Smithella sp.]|nr:hypothetical protein [Smithella sp.]HQL97091.1 hypothetical protein [Smithella sp.]
MSCRCRPASITLSVIPAKAGIRFVSFFVMSVQTGIQYSFLVPGFRREDEEVTHISYLDSRQGHAGMT